MEGGGVYCGWENGNHSDFLRLRSKHKGRLSVAFLNDVRAVVPGETEESVKAHHIVYEKYLELTERKKNLIGAYNRVKREQKKAILGDQKNETESKGNQKENRSINRCASVDRRETQERLKQWKQEKEMKRVESMKRAEDQQRMRAKVEERRIREQEEKKQSLAAYKERKMLQQQMMMEQEQRRHAGRPPVDKEAWKRIQARQEQALRKKERMRQEQRVREAEAELKEALKVQAMQRKYENVQGKLQEPTAAVALKKKEKFDGEGKDALTMAGNLLGTTTRAMVGWQRK